MRALDGLRVIDLTANIAGPYGSLLLADLGAEVIKIEPPGDGDPTRTMQRGDPTYHHQGMSSYFINLGRNKKSVVLDLHSEKGKEVFYDLVRVADVVLDNFRPGVMERLGGDYLTLREINPRIIACSITGYGLTGPARDRPAFDACIQAYAGVMSITGSPGGIPMRPGIPYADLSSGALGAMGVLAAVVARERTGLGQQVDLSMLDVQLSMMSYMATMYLMSGVPTPRLGNEHFAHVPYNAYETQDIPIFLAILPAEHWAKLLDTLEGLDLGDDFAADLKRLRGEQYTDRPGRLEDRQLINDILARILRTRPCEEWVGHLLAHGVPCAPVNTMDRALNDPQAAARNMVVEVEHPLGGTFRVPGNPIKLSATGDDVYAGPPLLGQHTVEVLRELLKYDDAKIKDLLAGGGATAYKEPSS